MTAPTGRCDRQAPSASGSGSSPPMRVMVPLTDRRNAADGVVSTARLVCSGSAQGLVPVGCGSCGGLSHSERLAPLHHLGEGGEP